MSIDYVYVCMCVYVCMHACMYVCLYVCVCIYMCVCMCVYVIRTGYLIILAVHTHTHTHTQEYSMKRVMEELPQILSSHAQPVDRTLFRNWRVFLDQFLAEGVAPLVHTQLHQTHPFHTHTHTCTHTHMHTHTHTQHTHTQHTHTHTPNHTGGVIEGTPPSDSVTPLTVGLFIDPTGAVTVQYTGDQLCSTPYNVWGITCPQTSVPPEQLVEAVRKVAVACQSRGLMGHLSIDFVTFLHPTTVRTFRESFHELK